MALGLHQFVGAALVLAEDSAGRSGATTRMGKKQVELTVAGQIQDGRLTELERMDRRNWNCSDEIGSEGGVYPFETRWRSRVIEDGLPAHMTTVCLEFELERGVIWEEILLRNGVSFAHWPQAQQKARLALSESDNGTNPRSQFKERK